MTEETETVSVKKSEKLAPTIKHKEKLTRKDKIKPLTKVIIRRLPPTMTEEEFLKQIDPIPDNEYFYYVPADWSLGFDATCRAYINFTRFDDIFLFKDRFDGYVFVDNKGAEYPAVVEYAPFQGLPRNKSRKCDPKCNTIESDQHFLNFLESLKENEENAGKSEVKLEFSLQSKDDKKMVTSTPLLQYLANKKQERRDERKRKLEEKRRQREEERQRKRTQVAKNVPPPIKEEVSKISKDNAFKNKEKEDAKKDAKSKRRAARDMKRKQEREKRNSGGVAAAASGGGQDKNSEEGSNSNNNQEKTIEKSDSQEKFAEKNDNGKKKEVKKYSQTRRTRNEARKNDSNTNITVEASSSSTSHSQSKEKEIKDSKDSKESADGDDKGEISESVIEFIKSIANIREFIPRSRLILTNADLENSIKPFSSTSLPSTSKKDVDMGEVCEKLEKIAIIDGGDAKPYAAENKHQNQQDPKSKSVSQDISPENGARDSSCSGTDKNDRGKDKDNRSIRRIRNKDRPSIEIYQPGKLRMKKDDVKDGRSSAELKDYKSNPTSDCESIKKEKDEQEGGRRKVSRYSERRSYRAKEKFLKDEKDALDCKDVGSSSTLPAEEIVAKDLIDFD